MATTFEFYFEHQIIRGDVKIEDGIRPIDAFNRAESGGIIALTNAWMASLHHPAPPVRLQAARLRRAQVLMIVPASSMPLPARRFRPAFAERQPLRAITGLGPFTIVGTHHIGLHEQATIVTIEHDPTGRFFVPITDAVVQSQYNPKWTFETPVLFASRTAISYTAPAPAEKDSPAGP